MTANRVGSMNSMQNASFELLRAQARQVKAQTEVATGKRATDLQGFGKTADVLTAARTVHQRVNTFLDNAKSLSARLETQNLAMEQLSHSADGARQAVGSAVAAGRAPTLMKELDSWLASAAQAMNMKHDGRYLFSGSKAEEIPVVVDNLSDLAAGPVTAAFDNDQAPQKSRLDESTVATSGFLADDMGSELFTVLRDIQLYHANPATGPLDGALTPAQEDFLKTQMGRLRDAHEGAIEVTAENGLLQNRVATAMDAQETRATTLEGFLGELTDVDMAEAFTRLEQAQSALQASAYALSTLQKMSLLDLLAPRG